MQIGIIGSGNVGGALGTRWAQAGHQIIFAARDLNSDKLQRTIALAGPNASAGTSAEAANCSIVLLATPWPATREALAQAGDLSGKILIDATNPLRDDFSGLTHGTTTSGAEQVASWAPGANVVKAFNTVGSNIMENASFDDGAPVLFYCGDSAEAKRTVHELAAALGFDPHDAGPLSQARVLEPFAFLWISLAIQRGYGREFAFHLMRRSAPE